MKRLIVTAFALLLFSSTVSAQGGANGNTTQALLGENGPVQGLAATLMAPQEGGGPLVNGLVSDDGLIRGAVASPANNLLASVLVNQDPEQSQNGAENTVTLTLAAALNGLAGSEDPSSLPGTLAALIGGLAPGDGLPGNGLGADVLDGVIPTGSGAGLTPEQLPLDGLDPGTLAALTNGATLPGL